MGIVVMLNPLEAKEKKNECVPMSNLNIRNLIDHDYHAHIYMYETQSTSLNFTKVFPTLQRPVFDHP